MTWRAKKQLFYFGIFAALIFLIVAGIIYFMRPSPTCFDKKQNQGEAGIDCGGPCSACVSGAKDPAILWTRFFESPQKGFYDAASLIENQNSGFKLSSFKYRFKLYDERNVLIALKEGESFLNAGDKLLILERDIKAGERTPARAGFEIVSRIFDAAKKEEIPVEILDKNFSKDLFPRVELILKNRSLAPLENIFIETALFDENNNVYQVNKTKIERIDGEAEKSVSLSWPFDFKEPRQIEVYLQKLP